MSTWVGAAAGWNGAQPAGILAAGRPAWLRATRSSAVQEDEVLLVIVSCPDPETATRLATTLVQEGLAACVNPLPEVTSTYRWEGHRRFPRTSGSGCTPSVRR